MTTATELRFEASKSAGEVSAIFERPTTARWLMVLGHGAGAGMRHHFMDAAASALGAQGIATFRYQFPYMEKKTSRPDPQPILLSTVRAAVNAAHTIGGDLPLLAGGKSMGGRMTSLAASEERLPNVRGLVFFGFPLHAVGAPSSNRADHLDRVFTPMLFLQGTRDKLAELELLKPVIERLGSQAAIHIVEGGDHSFAVPKKSGRTLTDVLDELAQTIASWADKMTSNRPSRS
jgi:predicted alpha/beta-hydrolase family hydrolase